MQQCFDIIEDVTKMHFNIKGSTQTKFDEILCCRVLLLYRVMQSDWNSFCGVVSLIALTRQSGMKTAFKTKFI